MTTFVIIAGTLLTGCAVFAVVLYRHGTQARNVRITDGTRRVILSRLGREGYSD